MQVIKDHESVDVFIGLDVGKGEHHAVALDRTGKKLFDKALPTPPRRRTCACSGLSGSKQAFELGRPAEGMSGAPSDCRAVRLTRCTANRWMPSVAEEAVRGFGRDCLPPAKL